MYLLYLSTLHLAEKIFQDIVPQVYNHSLSENSHYKQNYVFVTRVSLERIFDPS